MHLAQTHMDLDEVSSPDNNNMSYWVFPHQEHELQYCLLPTRRGTLYCQDLFSCSAIIASHSCGPCHADCLAFSFLGGSIEALTCTVSLYSTCSFSLPVSARQHSPPPTGLPEHWLLEDKPFSPPLSLEFFISFLLPIFSIASLYLFHSARPSIKANSSPNSCALMSARGERGVLQ